MHGELLKFYFLLKKFFSSINIQPLQIFVVLGAVLGTIIYRISLVAVIYSSAGTYLRDHAKIFTSMTAALINLIIIMILTKVSTPINNTNLTIIDNMLCVLISKNQYPITVLSSISYMADKFRKSKNSKRVRRLIYFQDLLI